MEIFNNSELRPAHAELFYSRGDVNDPRLGETTTHTSAAYAKAAAVILGCPQDEGVRRNGGRVGAALAPTEIRRHLYRLTTNGLENLRLLDLGDIVPQATLEQTHAVQQQVVQRLLEDRKRVIVLGGGNDISYPDCSALAAIAPKLLAFNIDAHFDVRADASVNSGTPYRQLLEDGSLKANRFHEVGSHPFSNSATYARWLADRKVQVTPLADLRRRGIERVFRRFIREAHTTAAVFWGFDVDVVRASDAPGVSAPNPVGMTGEEFCTIAAVAGHEARTRVVEFTECNPAFDVDGRTSRLVAVAIYHYLAALAESLRK